MNSHPFNYRLLDFKINYSNQETKNEKLKCLSDSDKNKNKNEFISSHILLLF